MDKLLLLGADPEFRYYDKAGGWAAASYFNSHSGIWGTDGYSEVAEIRPGFSEDALVLVAKLHKAISVVARNPVLKALEWRCGNWIGGQPVGGHIHISHPSFCTKRKTGYGSYIYTAKRNVIAKLIPILDSILYYGVGRVLEDPQQRNVRATTCGICEIYGRPGNWRDHKAPYVIEYRSCGSWLLSPEVALIYLGLAKLGALWTIEKLGGISDRKERQEQRLKKGVHTLPDSERLVIAARTLHYIDFIGTNLPNVPKDCEYAIETFKYVAPTTLKWDVDFKKAWLG